jgi:hypothetical protein
MTKKGSVLRDDTVGGCRPEPLSFVAPRRQPRGLLEDAVPKEVRDASLPLGKTIKRTLGKTIKRTLGKTIKRTLGKTRKVGSAG